MVIFIFIGIIVNVYVGSFINDWSYAFFISIMCVDISSILLLTCATVVSPLPWNQFEMNDSENIFGFKCL